MIEEKNNKNSATEESVNEFVAAATESERVQDKAPETNETPATQAKDDDSWNFLFDDNNQSSAVASSNNDSSTQQTSDDEFNFDDIDFNFDDILKDESKEDLIAETSDITNVAYTEVANETGIKVDADAYSEDFALMNEEVFNS